MFICIDYLLLGGKSLIIPIRYKVWELVDYIFVCESLRCPVLWLVLFHEMVIESMDVGLKFAIFVDHKAFSKSGRGTNGKSKPSP